MHTCVSHVMPAKPIAAALKGAQAGRLPGSLRFHEARARALCAWIATTGAKSARACARSRPGSPCPGRVLLQVLLVISCIPVIRGRVLDFNAPNGDLYSFRTKMRLREGFLVCCVGKSPAFLGFTATLDVQPATIWWFYRSLKDGRVDNTMDWFTL